MKIRSDVLAQTVEVQFFITEDQPVVAMTNSSTGKKLRVYHGIIKYHFRNGRWDIKSRWDVVLVGAVLKQDGSDSKNNTRQEPDTSYGIQWEFTDEYVWLMPIIDLLRPAGKIGIMVANNATVGP